MREREFLCLARYRRRWNQETYLHVSATRADTRAEQWSDFVGRTLTAALTNWRKLLWAAPALLAGVYLVVMWVDYHQVITSINMHGDVVIAPVLGKLAGQAPAGRQVFLGHHPWYEEYLFLRATAGLP